MDNPNFKCGLVVLVGRTNSGKSTLLNALVGTKIAIVTDKPQTTRDTYHGIVHRPEGQIVFVDTPGIFKTQPTRLVQNLHHKVRDAVEGIDVIVQVADPTRAMGLEDDRVSEMVEKIPHPKILCLNKSDCRERPFRESWLRRAEKYVATVELSALKGDNVDLLIKAIFRHLPVGAPLYPDGQVTNVSQEFWITELIREKVYQMTGQEVPYTATLQLEKVEDRRTKEGKPMLYIQAAVLTTDERYKRMLIGHGGQKIKDIGSAARRELEVAMNRKVFLDLTVLVDDEWMSRMQ